MASTASRYCPAASLAPARSSTPSPRRSRMAPIPPVLRSTAADTASDSCAPATNRCTVLPRSLLLATACSSRELPAAHSSRRLTIVSLRSLGTQTPRWAKSGAAQSAPPVGESCLCRHLVSRNDHHGDRGVAQDLRGGRAEEYVSGLSGCPRSQQQQVAGLPG